MKKSKKRVIPGFGLTMGVTITMLSIVVLIPLASLVIYSSQLGFNEFIEVITRKRILSSFLPIQQARLKKILYAWWISVELLL